MSRSLISFHNVVLVITAVVSLAATETAHAQSGTRNASQQAQTMRVPSTQSPTPMQRHTPMQPQSATPQHATMSQQPGMAVPAATQTLKLGLSGYCPVCVVNMKKWMKGSQQFQATYDGAVYYFPGEKQKQMFLEDPAKYAPALGGDCTVCLAKMEQRVAGSVHHSALHRGRLFLFPAASQKQEFVSNPDAYANVDLAMDGNCVVCKVEMGQMVKGDPAFTATHQGMRYLFPSAKQRTMFLANPPKYTTARTETPMPTPDLGSRSAAKSSTLVSFRGTSSCAGCEYGVKPIGSPNELGLALETSEGVVVVEDAHLLYPEIYKARFQGVSLAVDGRVLKTDGRFTWVKPDSLRVSN